MQQHRSTNYKIYNISSRGFAILLSMGALLLLSIIVISFLETVRTEKTLIGLNGSEQEARRAASSAVQLVMAQIQKATSDSSGVWSSQPGLIRVHQSGNTMVAYKLYSSDPSKMISSSFKEGEDDFSGIEVGGNCTDLNQPIYFQGRTVYPILDPSLFNNGDPLVKGLENRHGYGNENFQMKVQWIYQLADGRLAVNGSFTKDNPPVARFAFWADDESTKVNINTASEGVYWDIPRTDSREDVNFSLKIPALNEFQRYPGHPATTSLSPILNSKSLGGIFNKTGREYEKAVYSFIPRISEGGSEGGTVEPRNPLIQDTDRLFGFVDEMIFKNDSSDLDRQVQAFSLKNAANLSFVLTANSRSPEETVFSTPRVTIWPLHTNKDWWTAAEKMIAFCSKLNGHLYAFQREKALDAIFDYQGISRNKELYAYLQTLISKSPPHLNTSLKNHWGIDADQNLTLLFDYIRSGPALQHPQLEKSYTTQFNNIPSMQAASGAVHPILINNTKGMGRTLSVSQVGIIISALSGAAPASMQISASIAVQFYNPSQGIVYYTPQGLEIRISGMDALRLNGNNLFGGGNVSAWESFGGGYIKDLTRNAMGGFLSLSTFFCHELLDANGDVSPILWLGGYPRPNRAPLWNGTQGAICVVDATAPVIFSGGTITVEIRDKNSLSIIQKCEVNLDSKTFNLPNSAPATTQAITPYAASAGDPDWLWWNKILYNDTALPRYRLIWPAFDTVFSSILKASSQTNGDFRLLAARTGTSSDSIINANFFESSTGSTPLVHDFKSPEANEQAAAAAGTTSAYYPGSSDEQKTNEGALVSGASYTTGIYSSMYRPQVNRNVSEALQSNGLKGDWDTGISNYGDGAYINKPDESFRSNDTGANRSIAATYTQDTSSRGIHYLRWYGTADALAIAGAGNADTWYSPNRQMPSPVMFGSLPSGVKRLLPWQTFLFSPVSAADCDKGGRVHPGWGKDLSDHQLLDFFRMPVAEPYAISDATSTAGKINVNFQLIPFSHIKRASGIHSALKSVKIGAIPLSDASTYKSGSVQSASYRFEIDPEETVKGIEEKFKTPSASYRTESEIAEIFLYPKGVPYAPNNTALYSWWRTRSLTGDNMRERPYVELFPRLTTRSNVFTVHLWGESLKKNKHTNPSFWDEQRDQVRGTFRGSTMIERYIDPQNPNLQDFALNSNQRLSDFYRFRIIQSNQLVP